MFPARRRRSKLFYMLKTYWAGIVLWACWLGVPECGFSAAFYRIDDGSSNSYLTCISADGRVYGGIGMQHQLPQERISMHLFGGAVSSLRSGVTNVPTTNIALYTVGSDFYTGGLWAMNSNGTFIVGETNSVPGNHVEAFRWNGTNGVVGLGDLPGDVFESYARGISGNGSVVVGFGSSDAGIEAFRWTASGGLQRLGILPGASESAATAISADGLTIAGYSGNDIFLWKSSTGMRSLGFLGSPSALSPDGRVLIGVMVSQHVFRWTETEGVLDLGALTNQVDARVYGMSGDGETIVGQAVQLEADGSVSTATIWDPVHGMRDLKTVLIQEYAIGLSGLQLIAANGISADGTTVVGEAHTICPSGQDCQPHSFGFVVTGLRTFRRPIISAVWRTATVELSAATQVGFAYALEKKTSLGNGSWTLVSNKAGNGATQTWTNNIGAGQEFFRIVVR